GGIIVHVPPGDRLNILPLHIAMVRAITNVALEVNVRFNYTRVHVEDRDAINHRLSTYPMEFELAFTLCHLAMIHILLYRIIGYYVVERTSFFTHQQFLTGLSRSLYWTVSMITDMSIFIGNYAVLCLLY
ncbi:hypothetical protein PFISCL1PPCAC_10955, partial [Pristionchus fissidentatus]